jgi:S1-C subfamily serine protease
MFTKLKTAFTALTISLVGVFSAYGQSTDVVRLNREVLNPTVRVTACGSLGSGTAIKVDQDGYGYILTNNHVVANCAEQVDGKTVLKAVDVTSFRYSNFMETRGTDTRTTEVLFRDEAKDLALLKTTQRVKGYFPLATLAKPDTKVFIGETVWASGGGLGQPPAITSGILNNARTDFDSYAYYHTTSPIVMGNSGGGLFHRNGSGNYYLIGVPSRVMSYGMGAVVTHLAYAIKFKTIYQFFKENNFTYGS